MTFTTQPLKGVASTALVVALALLFCAAITPDQLLGWGTLIPVAMVPAQMVLTMLWGCQQPRWVADMPQPRRGLALLAVNVAMGLPIAWLAWQIPGGGVVPPTPFVNMYLILCVPTTMWLIIVFQGWPFNRLFKSPGAMGLALWLSAHGLAYGLFQLLFNFNFLSAAPFYRAELDPSGLLMAWAPLVASIATAVAMLALVLLDFWPVTWLAQRFPSVGRQPVFGVLAGGCVAAIAALMWWGFVVLQQMDLVIFLVRVCVSMAFGIFILLVTMEAVPALQLPQPWRGLVLNGVAVVLAVGVFALYQAVARACFQLPSGQPAYVLELWISSAMLAITFPAMVAFANCFGCWPLVRPAADPAARP